MKKRFNPPGIVARAMEELERVMRSNPGLTMRDISKAIGRNQDFLTDLKISPDKYILGIQDVAQLNAIYGIDDIYIYKGTLLKEMISQYEKTQAKLSAIRTLVNSN